MRIGIDVGGTNTDAVLMSGTQVLATTKQATSDDVTSGVVAALRQVLPHDQADRSRVRAVMIGTTQFTNAVVQRRDLARVAVLRLCGPATRALPPLIDWPPDLAAVTSGYANYLPGGHEFDGREIAALDHVALEEACTDIEQAGLSTVAVSGVFSPVSTQHEEEARALIHSRLPGVDVTLSHEIGRIGLLERENATVMNASLLALSRKVVRAFQAALAEVGLACPLFLTQNDGTLMNAGYAMRFPVLTFASGPTNSMRGAAFLSGLKNAVVADIGGTTTDVGALHHGFPREAGAEVEIAGVRTNFRMPDLLSIGIGGGSIVQQHEVGLRIGPQSVGHRLTTEAVVFGGSTVTATDLAVVAGRAIVGDRLPDLHLLPSAVHDGLAMIRMRIEDAVDRIKLSAEPAPVVVVGGAGFLIGDELAGASRMVRPDHADVANAVGAAIAQVSGEVDRVIAPAAASREQAIQDAVDDASRRAITAGADPHSLCAVEVEEVPLAYLPGNVTRVRVKVVGDLLDI